MARKARANKVRPEHIKCRMSAHRWDEFFPSEALIPLDAYTHIGWRCSDCGMIKIDVLDKKFDIIRRKYLPPDGYRLHRHEIPTRSELRREFINRRTQG